MRFLLDTHTLIWFILDAHQLSPFDRLLIAQSQVEQLPILSRDVTFEQYGVQRVWTL